MVWVQATMWQWLSTIGPTMKWLDTIKQIWCWWGLIKLCWQQWWWRWWWWVCRVNGVQCGAAAVGNPLNVSSIKLPTNTHQYHTSCTPYYQQYFYQITEEYWAIPYYRDAKSVKISTKTFLSKKITTKKLVKPTKFKYATKQRNYFQYWHAEPKS